MSGNKQSWIEQCAEFASTQSESSLVLVFPEYRPDLAKLVAHQLQLEFFDYRLEVMATEGPNAASIELDSLDQTLSELTATGGTVVFNVEALLATKSAEQRTAWLEKLLRAEWKNPLVIPITLFADETSGLTDRILRFEPEELPEQSLVSRLLH